MVLTLKVKKEKGQQAIDWIRKKGWLDTSHKLGKTQMYLIIPLNKSADSTEAKKQFSGMLEEKNMPKQEKHNDSFTDKLSKVLTPELLKKAQSSFEVVGSIAILEIPEELEKQEKAIAWTLLRSVQGIKTVAKRASITNGKYRIRKVEVLAGEKTTETTHTESGVKLKLDLNKVYFTPRWASERLRIAKQVKVGEKILTVFCGIGPFPLVINKMQPKVNKFTSIEINPVACEYFKENIRLNCNIYSTSKSPAIAVMEGKHEVLCGDAAKIIPKLKEKFDRIIMPLPKEAINYLDLTLDVAKKNALIHLYIFERENKLRDVYAKISEIAKKSHHRVKILKHIRAGAYAPEIYRWCIDIKVLK